MKNTLKNGSASDCFSRERDTHHNFTLAAGPGLIVHDCDFFSCAKRSQGTVQIGVALVCGDPKTEKHAFMADAVVCVVGCVSRS